MTEKSRILFIGTSAYAVPGLEALAGEGYDIPLVITQPDKPSGRGRKLTPPPVKIAARRLGIPVLQPASVRDEAFIREMAGWNPDLLVVVSFGRILPKALLDIPRLGAVNIHPSLLPAYRGPSPIQWAVVNMETVTGVTSIYMDEGMDSGDMIASVKTDIDPGETAGELHDRLAVIGSDLLKQTIRMVAAGQARRTPQDHSRATFAPLLTKSHGRIDWSRPARELVAFIHGMTPWPGAYTFLNDRRYRILRAETAATSDSGPPGTVLRSFPGELRVAAGDGVLSVLKIQSQSGKALPVADFLRGFPIAAGSVFLQKAIEPSAP
ncbi:MAG: methionyl-tRNA formyltransferase [Thermodesulfobacteriota bacterium]